MRMSNFFQVDLGVLAGMTKSPQSAGEQMDSALRSMSSSQDGQFGTDDLNSAANDFQSTWQYGLKQLQQMIRETNEGVGKAHDAYQQADDTVGQAVKQIGSGTLGAVRAAAGQIHVAGAGA
jgi:uncharacterized protein YukE